MSTIGVHLRIHQRHPELTDEDVVAAMRGMLRYQQRTSGEWIAIGLDAKGRLVELVYQYDSEADYFLVFHGMVPPSRKTLRELGMKR